MTDRRQFLKTCALASAGLALPAPTLAAATAAAAAPAPTALSTWSIIGPKEGFSPLVGTLASMLEFTRTLVLRSARDLTMAQLDHLSDAKANSIGALLLHLSAAESFYQANTFDNRKWGDFPPDLEKRLGDAMSLGDRGRKSIKGHELQFYVDQLNESRARTLAGLKQRDDAWLLGVDDSFVWGPTNNYCKWFHVAEHESNHNGQIKYLKQRLPGAKGDGE
jgi:hypothetical protein